MKTISIYKSSYQIIVDDEDFERVSQLRWVITFKNGTVHMLKAHLGKRKYIQIGNCVLKYNGIEEIDYKDRNQLNNQKENLRFATRSQQNSNKEKWTGVSSIYKGVHYCKVRQCYVARVQINGNRKIVGQSICQHEAAKMYNIAAIKMHGEFAVLNKISIVEKPDGMKGVKI